MKERPILFNGEMVRAILDGRKTMHRVPVDPQPAGDDVGYGCIGGQGFGFIFQGHNLQKCPFGEIGDLLWVQETWASSQSNPVLDHPCVMYRATDPEWGDCEGFKWNPSVHMPRDASRITLEITNVFVARLEDMWPSDAKREGVLLETEDAIRRSNLVGADRQDETHKFFHLWDSIYASKGFSFDSNPWVWVVEFKRIKEGE